MLGFLREALRCLGLLLCCAVLVLFVPSSAWADDTEQPSSSDSSSPSDGSSTPPPESPAPSEPVSSSPPEVLSEEPSEPTPTVTVTETTTPAPSDPLCTAQAPCAFEPSKETATLWVLLGGTGVMCLLALVVRTFSPR